MPLRLPRPVTVAAGKAARTLTRLRGGSGSAFPGLVAERIDPTFMARTMEQLPLGVVVVSGTNGKTTTTKMVVELLRGQGLRVFTNRSGSNFTRGVVASLLGEVGLSGRLEADIAVLELDEAHAIHFVRAHPPRYALLLNVMRDQLDRFGEIDTTAQLLRSIAEATTDGVVLNREDSRVAAIADSLADQQVRYFGLAPQLHRHFPGDDDLHASGPDSDSTAPADVVLTDLSHRGGTFRIGDQEVSTSLSVNGIYNTYNAAAALTLVRLVLGRGLDQQALLESLAQVSPAFGRGESLTVAGQPLDLVLVKNPSGFRLGLSSFSAEGVATMIAINDDYADGRDMSWLWDVSFGSLAAGGVAMVSGVRTYDMALRLSYDDVPIEALQPDVKAGLEAFLAAHPQTPKRIFCTYTAMLSLRQHLSTYTHVEEIA